MRLLAQLLASAVLGRRTVEQVFNLMGLTLSTDIKKAVTSGTPIPPPNAPSTARRKRRGKAGIIRTLIDTGRMVASVSWAYVTGDQ